MPHTPLRVTLSGYYGFANAGDEAVLAGLAQSLRALRPADELAITALSINPEETRRAHGIEAAHRYKSRELLPALKSTDALLSGGGSLLQDVTSAHGIFYYLGVVRVAQMLGKKTAFIAQGIGPLVRPRSRKLVAAVANRLDAVTVRDTDSAELLRAIGVRKPPIEVTADPALLLSPAHAYEPLKGDSFGVALRPWQGHDALALQVAEACRLPLAECRALLFAMQPESDKLPMEQFGQKWRQINRVVDSPSGLTSLLPNLGCCQMIVGMRLHALILAAACGVPSAALSYDPKVAAFMAQSGQSDAVHDLARDDIAALPALLARVWGQRTERAAALMAQLPALRAAASRNAEVALGLL
ncbi:MAG: polysaccharide pyruvyl transferase CsaB [Armatimonadota bacterium]|nr:polysaccharide pyruvyl transferase CsaB [Armatimonadota bacterium]